MKRLFLRLIFAFCLLPFAFYLPAKGQDSISTQNLNTVKWSGRTSIPSLSTTGNAVCYFDKTLGKIQCSQNGGAFADLGGGSSGITISTTTITGGTDTRVLFDDAGTVGEDAGLVFNKTTNFLTVTGGGITLSTSTINKVTITPPATSATFTIADGKTFTISNTLTLAGTDSTVMTFPSTSATIARTDAANTFTGHQTIEGVTSTGATGTGRFVFDNTPTLITPVLGVATATSINGLTITSSTGTFTLTNGKTFSVAKSLTLDGTDSTTMTFPTTSATIARTDAGQTFTGTQAFGAITASGTIVQTSASATAFESGPNGSTNPVLRLVNSAASAATGVSITGRAAGASAEITALSSGTDENLKLTPKGAGVVFIPGGSAAAPALTLLATGNGFYSLGGGLLRIASGGNASAAFGAGTHFFYDSAGSGNVNLQVVTANEMLVGGSDAGTTNVISALNPFHNSSGTPAAGFGAAVKFSLKSSTTATQDAAQIAALWTTATHASRTADLVFYTVTGAAALAEGMRLTGAGLIRNPTITADTGLTDTAVCQDTTNHEFHSGSGAAGICLGTSSARFKHDIIDLNEGLNTVLKLRPRNFFYNKGVVDSGIRRQYGFIAEETDPVAPGIVVKSPTGQANSVDYGALFPILVKSIQEMQAEIDQLKRDLAAQKK